MHLALLLLACAPAPDPLWAWLAADARQAQVDLRHAVTRADLPTAARAALDRVEAAPDWQVPELLAHAAWWIRSSPAGDARFHPDGADPCAVFAAGPVVSLSLATPRCEAAGGAALWSDDAMGHAEASVRRDRVVRWLEARGAAWVTPTVARDADWDALLAGQVLAETLQAAADPADQPRVSAALARMGAELARRPGIGRQRAATDLADVLARIRDDHRPRAALDLTGQAWLQDGTHLRCGRALRALATTLPGPTDAPTAPASTRDALTEDLATCPGARPGPPLVVAAAQVQAFVDAHARGDRAVRAHLPALLTSLFPPDGS